MGQDVLLGTISIQSTLELLQPTEIITFFLDRAGDAWFLRGSSTRGGGLEPLVARTAA
jgi:hypothetical protein